MTKPPPVPVSRLNRADLVRDLGWTNAAVQWREIKSVQAPDAERHVYLLEQTGTKPLIVKHEPGVEAVRFEAMVDCYTQLASAFEPGGRCQMAPMVLARPEQRLLVLEHVAGPTAHARLAAADVGLDRRDAVIQACAGWLRQLHDRAGQTGAHLPGFTGAALLRRVRRRAREVRDGGREVVFPKRFLGLCALLHRVIGDADGAPCRQGLRHGDAHARNFIFGGAALCAIDPLPREVGPVAFDLTRFMTRLAYSFGGDPDAEAPGPAGLAGLPKVDWQALEAGYGAAIETDPVVRALLCQQLFNDWLGMPAARDARSPSQQRRITQIATMFEAIRDSLA
ncbi:phosphotransferase [Tritonibacter horizontis]|uniref:Aminoglycoside phosphotransferase domain-containing protein n=1 Tax=Tritonibacter horizontis TaxID=1768241 RepID=A0A132BUH4_9RHOB|nr:phosphotransferase [Tritonibacter horizontis]KUP91856.1 hypothetical protein TRIHO_32760 [Tritonibacter horizontis]